jgi:hypothetical protein
MEPRTAALELLEPFARTPTTLRSYTPTSQAFKNPSRLSYPEPEQRPSSISSLESSTNLLLNTQQSDSPDSLKSKSKEFFKSSVSEFLKKSNEMKDEFRKLEDLCKELSPKRKPEKPAEGQDPLTTQLGLTPQHNKLGGREWSSVNELLVQGGFKPLSVEYGQIDAKEVAWAMKQLLNAFEIKRVNLREANIEITRLVSELNSLNSDRTRLKTELRVFASRDKEQSLLDGKLKQLEHAHRELMAKLKQTEQRLPSSPQAKVGLNEREKSIFKAFLGRDYTAHSHKDSKVMGIILMYEEQLELKEDKITKLYHKEQELYRELRDSTAIFTGQGPRSSFVKKLSDLLDCEATEDGVLTAMITVLKVIRVLPSIKAVLKQACELVLSPSQPSSDLIPTLQRLVRGQKASP